jgi:nucleotide-binding universal stress UspA family protein
MRNAMRILLAVDGSEYSLAAVREVASLPWPKGSVVRIVSVAETPIRLSPWTASPGVSTSAEWDRMIEERVEANTTQARAVFAEIAGAQTEVTTRTLAGDPRVAVLDEVEDWSADLLVVGTHGYNVLERLWLGSVSRALTAHANCSVRIVRGHKGEETNHKIRKILLAVDGSEFGDAAVDEVAGRPWPGGTELHVISVARVASAPTPEARMSAHSYYDQLDNLAREHAESAVDRAITRLRESNAERDEPLVLTSRVMVGHAEEVILAAAKTWGEDLVILGSHGYRGLKRLLLGSVSQAVAWHAPCSIEIVRIKQEKVGSRT